LSVFFLYYSSVLTDIWSVWKNLATTFKSNGNVIFDLMNEPNGIDASVVFTAMQAAVNSIRTTGATQLILVEGTAWTGAWSWESSGNAAAFASLTDPGNNFAIEFHQYLDSDSSGSSATCVSSTIGAERLQVATQWLQKTGFKGFLGEIGAGSNSNCIAAVYGAFCSMQTAAGSPWIGATWWAGSYSQVPYLTDANISLSGPVVGHLLPEHRAAFWRCCLEHPPAGNPSFCLNSIANVCRSISTEQCINGFFLDQYSAMRTGSQLTVTYSAREANSLNAHHRDARVD
jgi:endoglucanase